MKRSGADAQAVIMKKGRPPEKGRRPEVSAYVGVPQLDWAAVPSGLTFTTRSGSRIRISPSQPRSIE